MTAKFPPGWTDSPLIADLTYEARWHYVALLLFCSRECRADGVLTVSEARACCDVEQPDATLVELAGADAVVREDDSVRVLNAARHLTSSMTFDEREAADARRRHSDVDRKTRSRQRVNDAVFSRDGYRCVACDDPADLTVDHIYPQVLGGDLGGPGYPNLQTLCRRCNASKGVRLDWHGRVGTRSARPPTKR